MIIEDTGNRFYSVRDLAWDVDAKLAHVWVGIEVKKVAGAYVPKAKAREMLVRKAATRIVEA